MKSPKVITTCTEVTKRKVLSLVSKIYDPSGFVSPAHLKPKLLIQKSWSLKLGWDEVWSEEAGLKFPNWMTEIKALGNIKFEDV